MKKTKMLKKNYEFKNVLSKGKYYGGKYIEAFIKTSNESQNTLGIAISTKICNSVERNHIKRLIRESYYFFEQDIKVGYSIIFLWKKKVDIENAKYENIKNDMNKIFSNAGLIEEKL